MLNIILGAHDLGVSVHLVNLEGNIIDKGPSLGEVVCWPPWRYSRNLSEARFANASSTRSAMRNTCTLPDSMGQ
ncbi:MAG: hypothetical protein M2R45_00535 [Verrucomicrobia subdivision 3 bacterium]|nr:hypothetical protein [Limisphaerales bacterium]MCS1413587.1 hypothetical protein [Limisphaerales bacterium]